MLPQPEDAKRNHACILVMLVTSYWTAAFHSLSHFLWWEWLQTNKLLIKAAVYDDSVNFKPHIKPRVSAICQMSLAKEETHFNGGACWIQLSSGKIRNQEMQEKGNKTVETWVLL